MGGMPWDNTGRNTDTDSWYDVALRATQNLDPSQAPTATTPGQSGGSVGGNVYSGSSGPIDVAAGINVSDVERQLREMAAATGQNVYDQTDLEGVLRNTGYNQGGVTLEQALANARQNYQQRAASTNHRRYDSQSAEGNALYGSGTGNASNTPGGPMTGYQPEIFKNTSPQFTDAIQRLMEDNALGRYRHLTNPDPNSGTALYEQYARQLFNTLQQPPYSTSDEAVIKGRAFDALSKERDQTIQQWQQEMARRNLPMTSGPALEGLRRINEHYETMRTQTEADFARDAIGQTRAQRFQALNTAGQLAGSEEGRLDKATQYAAIPYGLSQDAFARNLSLVNAGGSPSSVLSSALALLSNGQQMNQFNDQQRAALTEGLLQYLGYLLA